MDADAVTRGVASTRRTPIDEVPSVAGIMLLVALLKLALVVAGFERIWRWIREHAQRAPLRGDVDPVLVTKTEYAVAMAAALYPGRAQCLERSLLLYWYLRRRGVAVRYRMGVQMYPFMAHAWIEWHGQPINDVPEHVKRFRPIDGVAT